MTKSHAAQDYIHYI